MPDFLRWELNAAKTGKPLPPGEFVWSPAMHFLFRRCPRAWFFRHYLAQGGWNELASDPAMHAYLLKYLVTADSWMSRAAEDSLTRALQEMMRFSGEGSGEALSEAFKVHVTSQLVRVRDDLERGNYAVDPKRTAFQELYYATGEFTSIQDLLFTMRNRFQDFFTAWDCSELPRELASTDPLAWRLPPEHRLFPYAGVQVSLRPWIFSVYRRRVTAWALRFDFSGRGRMNYYPDDSEEYGLSERVFAAWCAGKYPGFELKIRNLSFARTGLVNRTAVPVPVSEPFVLESANAMLREVNRPGGLKADDFPRLKDQAVCSSCRFRELCSRMPAAEGNNVENQRKEGVS